MAKEKTFKREVVGSIVLVREGKRINLTTGQVFEFTAEEHEQIMTSNPKAISAKTTVDLDAGDADLTKLGDEDKAPPAAKAKVKGDDL